LNEVVLKKCLQKHHKVSEKLGQPLEEGKSEATSFSFYLCAHMYVFQGVVMGGFACVLVGGRHSLLLMFKLRI